MADFDWKGFAGRITAIAPTIGAALAPATGGGSVVVGAAIGMLGKALGLPAGSTPDQVATAVQNATPDQLLTIKKADNDFAVQMKQLDVDVYKIDADDRASARQRQVQTGDNTPTKLAFIIIGGFFAYSAALLYGFMWMPDAMAKIPSQGWVVIGTVYGYLAAEAKQAAAFFFGSSTSSRAKDDTISFIAKQD